MEGFSFTGLSASVQNGGKIKFQNAVISFEWLGIFQNFCAFDILVVSSFRNFYQISYNNKNKIWRELSDVIFPPKMPKSEKHNNVFFFGMVCSILLHNFKCIALKLKKINKSERFLCHICPPCVILPDVPTFAFLSH